MNNKNDKADDIRNVLRSAISLNLPINLAKLARQFNRSRQRVMVLKNEVELEFKNKNNKS